MKHLGKFLAIALALLLMAALFARAEQLDVYSLTIKDPVVYVNSMPMVDLTGLGIEGSTASVDGRQVVRLKLLGNGEPAADAYLAFDGRWLLAGAEGISNIYGLPIEKLPGFSDMAVNSALLTALFSEETIEQVTEVLVGAIMSYGATIEQSMVDQGTKLIDHAAGQLQMQGVTITLKAADLQALFDEIGAGLEAIPAIEQLMMTGGAAAGYDLEKEEDFDLASILGDIVVTVWIAEDGETMRIEANFSILNPEEKDDAIYFTMVEDVYQDEAGRGIVKISEVATQDGEEKLKIDGNVMTEEFEDGVAMEMDMYGVGNFEGKWKDVLWMKGSLYPKGYTADNPDRTVFDFSMDTLFEGDDAASFKLNGYYAPADGANYQYDELSASLYAGSAYENTTIELLTQNQHENGQEYYGLQLTFGENDQINSVYYTFEGAYSDNAFGGEDHSGSLKAGFSDGEMAVEFSADIATGHAAADSADMPSFDGTPINVMTLGEKDMDLLQQEGMALIQRVMASLSASVPGLQGLLSSGML